MNQWLEQSPGRYQVCRILLSPTALPTGGKSGFPPRLGKPQAVPAVLLTTSPVCHLVTAAAHCNPTTPVLPSPSSRSIQLGQGGPGLGPLNPDVPHPRS